MQAFEVAASMMKKGATRRSVPPMQSEDRVSGLMPEQMISQSPMLRIPQIPKSQYRTSPPSSPFPPYPQQAQQQVQPSQPVTSGRTQPIRDRRPPADWLTPRVYKGSSNF
jgi:hypothetical protein